MDQEQLEENFDYLNQFNIVELKAIVRARTLQLHATIKEKDRLEKLLEKLIGKEAIYHTEGIKKC